MIWISRRLLFEDYLDSFPGIVIAVSHDRYFLDRVVRRIFAFEGQGRVVQYEGGFTDYQTAWEQKQRELGSGEDWNEKVQKKDKKPTPKPRGERKLKFTYKEQKEWETIEEDITRLEEETASLEQQMEEAASDYGKLNELMVKKQEKEQLLEEKMERWMYLNDLAEQIKNQ